MHHRQVSRWLTGLYCQPSLLEIVMTVATAKIHLVLAVKYKGISVLAGANPIKLFTAVSYEFS
jgi:hypothetical protein